MHKINASLFLLGCLFFCLIFEFKGNAVEIEDSTLWKKRFKAGSLIAKAEKLIIDYQNKKILFQGKVHASCGNMDFFSDQAEIVFSKEKKVQGQSVVAEHGLKIEEWRSEGHIFFRFEPYIVTATSLFYQKSREQLELVGYPVSILRGQSRLEGCKLILNTKTGNNLLYPCGKRVALYVDPLSLK